MPMALKREHGKAYKEVEKTFCKLIGEFVNNNPKPKALKQKLNETLCTFVSF